MEVAPVPKWYNPVSAAGLVWNAIGLFFFINQLVIDASTLPESQRAYIEGSPWWATASFGLAVISGVLGCMALIMRKQWAVPMFYLCLVGIILQNVYSLVLSNGIEAFGAVSASVAEGSAGRWCASGNKRARKSRKLNV